MSIVVSKMPKDFTGCALIGKNGSIYMPDITKALEFSYLRDGIYVVNRASNVAFRALRKRILEFLRYDFAGYSNENYRIYMYVGLEADENNSVLLDMTLYVGYGIKKDNKIYLFKERNGILRVVILDGRDFPELKEFDNVIGLSLADVVSGKWIAIVE